MSLVLHVLILGAMVLGLKVLRPAPEERAVELQLIPPPEFQPRRERVHRGPRKANSGPSPGPPATPQAASDTAKVPATSAAPKPAAPVQPGLRGLAPSLSGRVGCDDAMGFRLTEAQRQTCADNLARIARQAAPLGPDIPDDKRAEYDLHARCRDVFRRATAVPPMTQYRADGSVVTGPSAGALTPGLGGCPLKDR